MAGDGSGQSGAGPPGPGSQQAGQPRSINQEIQARKKAVERVQAQELSSAEINRIVDRVYDKLERKIATEYRRRGL